jgi:type 1 glutamine amidotransferase
MKGMIDTPLARHWFMHTPHVAVGVGASPKVPCRLPRRPDAQGEPLTPPQETRLLRVGLVVGAGATCDLAADRLAEHLLRDRRLEVDRAWDLLELGVDEHSDYDCLVLLGWPAASSRGQIKRIELHCRGGGSLVALRAMHADVPGWSSFAEEVLGGRQPAGRKCRLLEIERSQSAWHHPIAQGVGTLIAEGEGYVGPRFSPEITVLLDTHVSDADGCGSTGRTLPVAWATRHEGGRVFCTTLGLEDDFREAKFLRLISNAVHWTGLVHS